MKKIFFAALILISSNFILFSQVSGDAQIIKSEHWVYQDLLTLSSELRIGNFSTNTPITVGEIKMYFNSGIDPCLVKPISGNDYEYLILPVRIN